jgi:hypothetical protein
MKRERELRKIDTCRTDKLDERFLVERERYRWRDE